jgi:hypothetical protein
MDSGIVAGSNSLARLSLLDGVDEKDNATKQKSYYKAAGILGRIPNKSRCLNSGNEPSQTSDTDNFNLDLYNNCTNLGWVYLELYKIDKTESSTKSDQEKAAHEKNLYVALDHLDEAVSVWENTFERIKNQGGKPHQKMFEHKEATAYCLRAQVFEEFAAQVLEDKASHEEYQRNVKKDWNECFTVLEDEEGRNPYEVEWFKEAQIKN